MKPKECADCGSGAVYHRFSYVTVAIDDVLRPIFTPGPIMRFIAQPFLAAERVLTPLMFALTIKLGLAKKIETWDDDTILLAQVLWEEGKARGIEIYEWRLFNLARNLFVARFPNGKVIAYEGIPFPPRGDERAWWMDNKAEMKKRFTKLGFPVAKGGHAFFENTAHTIYSSITPPVIIKPHSGSGSRHTILHIDTPEELLRAFRIAKQVSPLAIIEEELVGPVYRATVVDGVFAASLRRDPPHVIGDGEHTIEELVAEENTHPARSGPYFSPIQFTPDALQELAWQDLTPTSIPKKGQRVTLHQKVNWGLGGTTADTTAETHQDNIQLFEDVAKALKAPIVGIDFIIDDIAHSWKEQERSGILECNSMPFFDNHHLPFKGEPQNVASRIWSMVEPSK
ncbi:hypothetical protein KKH15_02335 [Patescibacteria group bacterium]|nr:hypothetical protein [Patescibacteria group bacterium]MBU1755215.1 hypothetical protein [Patescibacteria group bacterium]